MCNILFNFIQGQTNLKILIDKLSEKDKRYNRFVEKVNYFKNKIETLKQENNTLFEHKVSLQNEQRQEIILETKASETHSTEATESAYKLDQNEKKLKLELEKLELESSEVYTKYEDVCLIYDNVKENIKNLIKIGSKEYTTVPTPKQELEKRDENIQSNAELLTTVETNTDLLKTESERDVNTISNTKDSIKDDEEDIVKQYGILLNNTKTNINSVFLSVLFPLILFLNLASKNGIC